MILHSPDRSFNHYLMMSLYFWVSIPCLLLYLFLTLYIDPLFLQVPGNLIISASSGVHSFDASQMNMSHVISHLSFGRKISPRVLSDVKRLIPYIGGSHDRLNGRSFINHRDVGANVTVSTSIRSSLLHFHIFLIFFMSATIQLHNAPGENRNSTIRN